ATSERPASAAGSSPVNRRCVRGKALAFMCTVTPATLEKRTWQAVCSSSSTLPSRRRRATTKLSMRVSTSPLKGITRRPKVTWWPAHRVGNRSSELAGSAGDETAADEERASARACAPASWDNQTMSVAPCVLREASRPPGGVGGWRAAVARPSRLDGPSVPAALGHERLHGVAELSGVEALDDAAAMLGDELGELGGRVAADHPRRVA